MAPTPQILWRPLLVLSAIIVAACGGDDPVGMDEIESTDPCDMASEISVGQVRAGTLTTQDCRSSNGLYQDRWSLTLSSALTVDITLESTQFDAYLELYDGAGALIGQNDDTPGGLDSRLVRPLIPGDYVIVVTTFAQGETGAYDLSVREGADCSPVGTVALGQAVSGTLSSTDCVHEFGALSDNWTLNVASEETLRIELESSEFEEGVLVMDAEGEILGGAPTHGPDRHAQFDITLQPGAYTVVATSLGFEDLGGYELRVSLAPPCGPGDALQLGVEVFGELTEDDCLLDFGLFADMWTLDILTTTEVDVVVKSLDFPPAVSLRDANGFEIGFGGDFSDAGLARLTISLEPGSYRVHPTSFDPLALGSYQLTVDLPAPCTPAEALELGVEVMGTLSATDCFLSPGPGTPADLWTLELDEEKSVVVRVSSHDFPPGVMLRDDTGSELDFVFDFEGTGTARIGATLAPGSYEVLPTTLAFGATGSYTLVVNEIECAEPQVIEFGETVEGTLTEEDCLRPEGAFQQSWTLTLDAETAVRIDLVSADFDPYLILRDAAGAQLAVDDDGGPQLNARIETTLAAGTYEIVASAFGAGQTGDYQLTVGAPPPATADPATAGAAAGTGLKADVRSGHSALPRQPSGLVGTASATERQESWLSTVRERKELPR